MEYVVYGLLVFLFIYLSGHIFYWRGYYKGYNKAKETYKEIINEKSATEEFNEFMKRCGFKSYQ